MSSKFGSYDPLRHPDVGRPVRTKRDVEFADGSVVAKGATGRVLRVDPGAERWCYMVKVDGNTDDTLYERGTKGFRREQFVFTDEAAVAAEKKAGKAKRNKRK